jgi:methylated-DNA-[protein]-cysteine S-methyltransferase
MQFHPQTCFKQIQSPWGLITLAASPEGLNGVWFEGQKHHPNLSPWQPAPRDATLVKAEALLSRYWLAKQDHQQSARQWLQGLHIDLSGGTAFQQAVWQALLSIPQGSTCSYGELAAAIGKPSAVRAVGSAIGRNPISILIPCHRVLGGQGQLTGYAGGVWRKQALLQLENALSPTRAAITPA